MCATVIFHSSVSPTDSCTFQDTFIGGFDLASSSDSSHLVHLAHWTRTNQNRPRSTFHSTISSASSSPELSLSLSPFSCRLVANVRRGFAGRLLSTTTTIRRSYFSVCLWV